MNWTIPDAFSCKEKIFEWIKLFFIIHVGSKKIASLSIWIFFNHQDWNRKKNLSFYLSVSFVYLHQSFPIFHLFPSIFTYSSPIHTNLFLSLSLSTASPIFLNSYVPIHIYPCIIISILSCLSWSVLASLFSITTFLSMYILNLIISILFYPFYNLLEILYFAIHAYPLSNHLYPFLSLLKYITTFIHFNIYLSIHIYPFIIISILSCLSWSGLASLSFSITTFLTISILNLIIPILFYSFYNPPEILSFAIHTYPLSNHLYPFLSFLQSTRKPIRVNPYLFIHINPFLIISILFYLSWTILPSLFISNLYLSIHIYACIIISILSCLFKCISNKSILFNHYLSIHVYP